MRISAVVNRLQCGFDSNIKQSFICDVVVKLETISLPEAVVRWGGDTTPVASLPLCGANHKSASPRLCGGHRGGGFNSDFHRFCVVVFNTDFHRVKPGLSLYCVRTCHICEKLCLLLPNRRVGIQPERLNAEGEA